jgi:excisionase family DNA binding protein
MADLLNLDDAAQLLNITNDELVKFTADGGIKGYRDGADTKYKKSDLEEFASARGIQLFDSELLDQLDLVGGDDEAEKDTSDDTLAGDPLGMDDDSFSLLDDDMEGDGEDSVLITKQDLNALEAAAASEPEDLSGASDDASSELADDDGSLGLADDDMDFDLKDDSTIMPDSGSTNLLADDDMDFNMEDDSTIMADSGMDLGLGDADTDDDTQLGVVDNFGVTDEDLVLGVVDSSDVTLGAADSGITLESPSDSGILLEAEDIDLSDSAATQLELPGAGNGLEVLIEDDKSFNLGTPDGADEMSDSGSQVIAISDSVALEDAPLEQIDLTDSLDGSLDQLAEVGPGTSPVPAGMAPPVPVELGYSAWIVLCLMMITLVLVVTGMMMADVVKTMWSWNEGTELSSSLIMDWVIGLFNMRPGP